MNAPRPLRRLKERRRRRPDRLAEQTRRVQAEVRETAGPKRRSRPRFGRRGDSDRPRISLRRPKLAEVKVRPVSREELATLGRGTAMEARRRLRPAGAVAEKGLGLIAPPVTKALLLAVRAPAELIALLLGFVQRVGGWLRARIAAIAAAVGNFLEATVTPVRTLAVVTIAAAGLLCVSQFVDYHGVAVSAPQYAGEVGAIADAPLTDRETTGSAHLYVLGVLGLAAIALAILTARGRWRLGRAIGLIGIAGIVVSLAIDLPQGLDAGRAGIAYEGSEARLIEGFWAQLGASAALLFCGPLLGMHARRATGEERPPRRRIRLRRRTHNTAMPTEARAEA